MVMITNELTQRPPGEWVNKLLKADFKDILYCRSPIARHLVSCSSYFKIVAVLPNYYGNGIVFIACQSCDREKFLWNLNATPFLEVVGNYHSKKCFKGWRLKK